MMSVSSSAYYAWVKSGESRKAQRDQELTVMINTAFTLNRAVYGTRRLKRVLKNQGDTLSRRRIGRIMQERQLHCKTKHEL
jgi:transposase InsO family protein